MSTWRLSVRTSTNDNSHALPLPHPIQRLGQAALPGLLQMARKSPSQRGGTTRLCDQQIFTTSTSISTHPARPCPRRQHVEMMPTGHRLSSLSLATLPVVLKTSLVPRAVDSRQRHPYQSFRTPNKANKNRRESVLVRLYYRSGFEADFKVGFSSKLSRWRSTCATEV